MDSIGDYIYLIIIAIAGLSSFMKKRKKAAETQQDTENEIPDFREIFGKPKAEKDWWEDETVYQPEPVRPEVKPEYQFAGNKPLETLESYDQSKDFDKLRIKKTIQESGLKPAFTGLIQEPEVEVNTFLSEIRLNDVDDARRAFIYTEIFNRKY